MEVQFHKGTVNIPDTGSRTLGAVEAGASHAGAHMDDTFGQTPQRAVPVAGPPASTRSKERRRTGREYRVYLVNRTSPETFFDYSGGCFSYQSYGGFFFFTTPGSKTFIPYHQIVRIEISG